MRLALTITLSALVGALGTTARALPKPPHDYGAMAYAEKRVVCLIEPHSYVGLVKAIAEFFQTRKPPVPIDETLEIMAFIQAALDSSKADGKDVPLNL